MRFEDARRRMVQEQLEARGISDKRLLQAFLTIPRHEFVSKDLQAEAYADHPLPIGGGQTISQPYMVALMVQLLRLQGHERVLEVGTGSGYQLAILSQLALEVYSIERLPELAEQALRRLKGLGYLNVHLTVGNGSMGWPAYAPYEAILVAAGAPDVPPPLVRQLADGGRLMIPIGSQQVQTLTLVEKRPDALHQEAITSCVFVPLVGEYGWRAEDPT